MFGHNEIVGQKYFKDIPSDELVITSRFLTIQGEGPFAGKKAMFLRLAKCNLNCSFCDTYFDSGDRLTFNEIIDQFGTLIGSKQIWPSLLVLTGGEPLLQQNIVRFMCLAFNWFPFIQIESNGIVHQNFDNIPDYDIDNLTLVISPKCSEKNGQYLKPHPKNLERANCLKFVVSSDSESPYHQVPDWAIKWKEQFGREIYVSPMNIYNQEPQKAKDLRTKNNEITIADRSSVDEVISFWDPGLLDMKANQSNHEYAAKYCMDKDFRLNLQLHLYCSLA